jgi:hypothetical protein
LVLNFDYYYRYVDDILIIYNKHHTNIDNTLGEFNRIHPKINFTTEKETQNKINYLDLTITKQDNKLIFAIYRKPTTTDSIIHNNSCHPIEHKKSAINYLINRMNTYPLTHTSKGQEQTIIEEILKKNEYQQSIIHHKRINKTHENPPQGTQKIQKEKQKWATFTYSGPETITLTNLFRDTNLKIAYKTTNTIQHHLKLRNETQDIYSQSRVYQL